VDRAPSGDQILGGSATATSAGPYASPLILIFVGGRTVPVWGELHSPACSDMPPIRSWHRRGHRLFPLAFGPGHLVAGARWNRRRLTTSSTWLLFWGLKRISTSAAPFSRYFRAACASAPEAPAQVAGLIGRGIFDLGARAIMRDYSGADGEPPVYGEDAFEERFRMPRPVFNRLFRAIHDQPGWRRTVNATGRPQAHAIQKVSAALRVLGFGEPFDRSVEHLRLSRSSIDVYTRRFTHFIIDMWESAYLRRPTAEELEHIMRRNAARNLPGCIGSIDCTHWTWARCAKALAGQYKDRNGKVAVVIETVCLCVEMPRLLCAELGFVPLDAVIGLARPSTRVTVLAAT